FLFVEALDFRFHGQAIDDPAGAVELVVTRKGEQPERALKTLSPALPRAERIALARRVIEPALRPTLEPGDDSEKLRMLEALAAVDPERVLERIEAEPAKNPWFDDYLRRAVAKSFLGDDPDEALAVVEAMRDPGWRSRGYLDVCDALPDSERRRKLELLGEALVHARAIQDAPMRLVNIGENARRLLELGEKEQATRLIRDGEAVAKELPTAAFAGYVRGAFAMQLARIDGQAALELVKDLSDPFEHTRHHGNIAHVLAARDPAEAERVLGLIREDPERLLAGSQWTVRVCYRMAPLDLERARRIADGIDAQRPEIRLHAAINRAHAYGVMAHAVAESQPDKAAELLRQAFGILEELVESGTDQFTGFGSAASLAGALLPVAERLDPRLVPEFFWLAVSFRLPAAEEPDETGMEWMRREQSLAALAMMLARYDRAVAESILADADPARLAQQAGRPDSLWTALCLIDPQGAVGRVETLSQDDDAARVAVERARITVARRLVLEGDDLWNAAQKTLGLWVIDEEDLGN
ncbi:MAG TPA: hypothetical protein VML55_09620, partial [Planctomycetaceae bacterium]|nr:hypothetical protein [Planctomycetaceae bacterium]